MSTTKHFSPDLTLPYLSLSHLDDYNTLQTVLPASTHLIFSSPPSSQKNSFKWKPEEKSKSKAYKALLDLACCLPTPHLSDPSPIISP